MGVLIFTDDAARFRVGEYVEGSSVDVAPNVAGLTVIVHDRKPKAADYAQWLDYIAHRMVVVCEEPPKMKDERVIIEGTFAQKTDHVRAIDATLRWRDRSKAFAQTSTVPMPLLLAFMRENNRDIRMWRMLAQAFTNTPEVFQQALACFAHKPVARMTYPKKKKVVEQERPDMVRESDEHWEAIVRGCAEQANEVRTSNPEALPKGMKKRKQDTLDGWL